MSSQTLSSPVPASVRIPAPAFSWVFALCAILAPMLLTVDAFAISPDAMERARIIVQGLESSVFSLVAVLIVRALYVFGIENDPKRPIPDSRAGRRATSA